MCAKFRCAALRIKKALCVSRGHTGVTLCVVHDEHTLTTTNKLTAPPSGVSVGFNAVFPVVDVLFHSQVIRLQVGNLSKVRFRFFMLFVPQILWVRSRVRFLAKTSRGEDKSRGSGDFRPPAGSRSGAPVGGLGDEVPQKPKDSKKNTGKILMF